MAVADTIAAQPAVPSFDGFFPLPLTTFETLMLTDARPDFPMLVDFEVHFQGRIDRAAFDKALTFALGRNPLFTCNALHEDRQPWRWVPSGQLPQVDWAATGTPIAGGFGEPIDLTQEIGLKIWVRHTAEHSLVLLQFHHACSDGVGTYAFIEDLMVGYNAALPGAAPVEPRPLEPERLKHRGLIHVTGRSLSRQIVDSIWGAVEGFRFYAERPLPMPPKVERAAASGQATFLTQSCGREVVEGLRLAANEAGANRNDVLIRDLMLTLRRWHGAGGRPPRGRRLRILMPQDLRTREYARLPACNALSFAFITRKASQCDAPKQLLASIAAETAKIRRWMLSMYFLGGLHSVQSWGILPWILRSRVCFATAVLSNLGDPARYFKAAFPRREGGLVVGNLIFKGVAAAPPVRPLTRASMCVVFGEGTLTVCMRCDPLCYSPADVQRLLGEYIAQLQETAAAASQRT